MRIGTLATCLLAAAAADASAQIAAPAAPAALAASPDMPSSQALLDRMINVPSAGYTIIGSAVTGLPRVRNDSMVQGGKAMRVVVAGRNAEP